MTAANVALLIRSVVAIATVAAIVLLAWTSSITGGEAIATLSALVGGILHASGTAQSGRGGG